MPCLSDLQRGQKVGRKDPARSFIRPLSRCWEVRETAENGGRESQGHGLPSGRGAHPRTPGKRGGRKSEGSQRRHSFPGTGGPWWQTGQGPSLKNERSAARTSREAGFETPLAALAARRHVECIFVVDQLTLKVQGTDCHSWVLGANYSRRHLALKGGV